MQLRVLSDLHLEFMGDQSDDYVRSLDLTDVDVCVLAGDIDVERCVAPTLRVFAESNPDVNFVFVPGNHEYYHYGYRELWRDLASLTHNPNMHILNGDVITLHGQRFLGHTLWFPPTRAALDNQNEWSDFWSIGGLDFWFAQEHSNALAAFRQYMQPGDVVVTHHLPSYDCVSPHWVTAWTNCYFVAPDCHDLIAEREPALWIHGHTHDSVDTTIGTTRVVCNPRGYWPRMLNPNFDPGFTIELPS